MKKIGSGRESPVCPVTTSILFSVLTLFSRAVAQEDLLLSGATAWDSVYADIAATGPTLRLVAFEEEPERGTATETAAPVKRVEKSPVDGWRFEIAPFLWAAEMDGKVGIGPVSAETEVSFSDIFDAMEFGAMAHAEIGWRRFGLLVDGMYIRLGDDSRVAGIKIDTTLEQSILQFTPSYRFGPYDLSPRDGEESESMWKLWLLPEVFAGGRYVRIEGNLDPSGIPSRSDSKDWLDPIVGARIGLGLTRRLSFSARGDIGGFGAASELTWSANALLKFQVSEHFGLLAGYHVLDWDFHDGTGNKTFDYNMQLRGPILGMNWGF